MAISKVIYKSSPLATPETWIDATPATAAAADIVAPKTAMLADGVLTTGTGSGGSGGASNLVKGTFTGTTTGAAMDVNIPYTGNGYPIALIIFPTEGPQNTQSGTFGNLVQRYAMAMYAGVKYMTDSPPSYDSNASINLMRCNSYQKSSASNPSSYTSAGYTTTYNDINAGAGTPVQIRSKTVMSVYIASDSYGFVAYIEYTYIIVYSS